MRQADIIIASLLLIAATGSVCQADEGDVIRLNPQVVGDTDEPNRVVEIDEPRRGFDYAAFEARLESLWFQRKTLLANGRKEAAHAQLDQIRAFCAEEGIQRLEHLAGALIAEAHRFHEEGNDRQALAALEFAQVLDPGRAQVHTARAAVLWGSGAGVLASGKEAARALLASGSRALQDMTLSYRIAFVLGLAWMWTLVTFALTMLVRYHAAIRHDIEEWTGGFLPRPLPDVTAWATLALPLILWVGAGWAALYWLVAGFRYASRSERLATMTLLVAGVLFVPGFGLTVGLYGTTADPAVRTTIAAVEGEYDPDHIVRLQRLVEAHPEDPAYHFLLAGLYFNGRYFEEAYEEYKKVLELDPSFAPAHVNIGNIFYTTGQYPAAINSYRNALNLDPGSFLAHFNLHLAQSEDFHFTEAESSLQQARNIDADRVAELLTRSNALDDGSSVQNASLQMVSVWEAAVGGRSPTLGPVRQAGVGGILAPEQFVHPVSIAFFLALVGCIVATFAFGRFTARRCIRCGRAFCDRCKNDQEGHEYCRQCVHLFVLRDGLAPETKTRKLYEIRVHEGRTRLTRRLAAVLCPGAGHILRGSAGRGLVLLLFWFVLLITAFPELIRLNDPVGPGLATDLLFSSGVPGYFDTHPVRHLAALGLPLVWLAGNVRLSRSRED